MTVDPNKPEFSDIVAALLWLGIMAFAVWVLGWSMNFWWYLGTL